MYEIFQQDAGDDPWLAVELELGSDDVLRAEAGLPERPANRMAWFATRLVVAGVECAAPDG